ncbi:ATPase [Infirmifilum lucidum]|uniref:ATPase n=1 Tax=Infirmifilum lucidum TaxID=2776706 RepID=A0A7L9FFW0_9CREN|nr:ATP cone domain-containing protein [Infirmifilum lucidum]QOJ78680.1 ATPase [Infirmifilum lucidum]
MGITVIKRDGSREEFAVEKIVVSCLKAGAPLDAARRIGKIVEGDLLKRKVTEITTKELMKEVLALLKEENEEWYRNWIIFDRAVKRRATEKEVGG